MSEIIRYEPPKSSNKGRMRTRRFFKLLLKNAKRYELEHQPKGYNASALLRDQMVSEALGVLGLTGNWYSLNEAMTLKSKNAKRIAKGRHFVRLGAAAMKKNDSVSVLSIALCVYKAGDLRTVKFNNELIAGVKGIKAIPLKG